MTITQKITDVIDNVFAVWHSYFVYHKTKLKDMAYDIYGDKLAKGHCEVHPWVGESYPCSLCYAESKPKHDPRQKEYERAEAEYYAEMEQAHYEELARENNLPISGVNGNTFKIVPSPITIRFLDPITNEIIGEFKEKDGLLTFEGKVDDSGKVFVDFICETFKKRIEHLYCH